MTVSVIAIAPTLGWSNVGLSLVEYVVPPADGLQEIILFGTPPNGPAAEIIQVFDLSVSFVSSDWYQGVKVRADKDNSPISLRTPTIRKPEIGQDPFNMQVLGLRADRLLINVHYGGGCQLHSFQLNWDGSIAKSPVPQITLELSHNRNGDTCKAYLSELLQFDLSTLPGFPKDEIEILVESPGISAKLVKNAEGGVSPVLAFGGGVVGNG